jgi:hypothetical protein
VYLDENDISAKKEISCQSTWLPEKDADFQWKKGISKEKSKGKT